MSGDGSLLTHTCFMEKVLNLSQKIAIKIVMYVEQATPIYDLRQFAQELPTMKVYMQKKNMR